MRNAKFEIRAQIQILLKKVGNKCEIFFPELDHNLTPNQTQHFKPIIQTTKPENNNKTTKQQQQIVFFSVQTSFTRTTDTDKTPWLVQITLISSSPFY